MNQFMTIAIDLAKDVFEIGLSRKPGRIDERHRLRRAAFRRWLVQQPPALVLFEACGTAHYWARQAQAAGHRVRIIPAQHVRPYRRGSKTDRSDVTALLEAARCQDIRSVPVKSVEQQQIQQLHRLREQTKKTRTARINALRGCLRELGLFIPQGSAAALRGFAQALDDDTLPLALRRAYELVIDEIRQLQDQLKALTRQIADLTRDNPAVQTLGDVRGIGLLTSSAAVAAAGSPHHFKSGRHFAAWVGLTPRENSSGDRRHLGRISKQGDRYLRTLFIHGGRSVLAHAERRRRAGQDLGRLERWALNLKDRVGHNKAAVALANKLARVAWAVWKHGRTFDAHYEPATAA